MSKDSFWLRMHDVAAVMLALLLLLSPAAMSAPGTATVMLVGVAAMLVLHNVKVKP